MSEKKESILFISSADPLIGPGRIAFDYVNALKYNGYNVDFLTKYPVEGKDEILYVLNDRKGSRFANLKYKLWNKIVKPETQVHALFYRRENEPPVPISKVLKAIKKDYDLVIIYFWQELLSYRTVEAIYDSMRIKPKVIYFCADYSPMTGGCHFFGDCEYFKSGCGNCPIVRRFGHKNDFSAKNVKDRIKINKKIKPFVFTNLYMQSFFSQSPVMQSGARLVLDSMILNLDKFKEYDRSKCRDKLGGIQYSDFVILFGCQNLNDERKGICYLLESLDLFYEKLSDKERDSILILTIGKENHDINQRIKFKQKHLGFVDFDNLPEIYSASDVFVSPSINDAGPSMVNQSIACGTPVISFEMGTALEVIKDTGAGICVPLKDSQAMANAIMNIFRQTEDEKLEMRNACRKVAEHFHSYDSFVKQFELVLKG